MLVNGREIVLDQRKAGFTQDSINTNVNLPDLLKTEVSKKQIKDAGYNVDEINSNVSMDMSALNGNSYLGGGSDLENRKGWYSTFQEMANSNFIHRGLQVIVDDACQKNTEGNVVTVVSDNEEIKEILNELFLKRLNLQKELWSIFFETIKLGDNFYEIIPDSYEKPTMIAKIRYLETDKVNRIEVNNKLAFYTYTTEILDDRTKQKQSEVQYRLQPWQIIHFKIEDKDFYPYGGSLLKSGVRTFRRLSMLEDAILVYRLARTPERRVFKVGVGNLSSIEANRFVQKVRDNYRTSQIIDSEGKINRKAASLSITQDIFVPVREGETGTSIEQLQGGQGLNTIDDLKFFRDEILLTMNIPPEYMGVSQDGNGGGKGSLAVLDSKFARFVERVQYPIEEGLTKLAYIELFFAGKKKEELQDFKIELTPPSNIKEIIDLEFVNQKMGLIQTMIGLNIFPTKYILKNVLRMSNKEINDVMLFKELEDQKKGGMAGAAGTDLGMGIGGMPPDMNGLPPTDAGAVPAVAGAPAMATPTEAPPLTQEALFNAFGKEFLIENKEDFMKILKESENYLKDKKHKETLLKEDYENKDIESLMEGVRKVLVKEKTVGKNNATHLFFEGELDGLSFESKTFKTFTNPKKKTGRKVEGSSDIVYNEEVTFLEGKKKRK